MGTLAKHKGPNACRREHMAAPCDKGMHKACLHMGICEPTDDPKLSWICRVVFSILVSRHLISGQRDDDLWQLLHATTMAVHAIESRANHAY